MLNSLKSHLRFKIHKKKAKGFLNNLSFKIFLKETSPTKNKKPKYLAIILLLKIQDFQKKFSL